MSETAASVETKQIKRFGRDRYTAGSYSTDFTHVADALLKISGQPATFIEVCRRLQEAKVKECSDRFSHKETTFVTESGKIIVEGPWEILATLRTIVELLRQGIDPHSVRWFYFDHDWSRDADELHAFFAVHGDKF